MQIKKFRGLVFKTNCHGPIISSYALANTITIIYYGYRLIADRGAFHPLRTPTQKNICAKSLPLIVNQSRIW